ncbi:helix-turn-helix transcriptional regulator [Sphingomonas sp. R647]|uniref:helix-turn-helix transcriptional regulator n=1 Tax=Sphingomonas sp. R647 TaxID=2875233 RepID=UPI0039909E98
MRLPGWSEGEQKVLCLAGRTRRPENRALVIARASASSFGVNTFPKNIQIGTRCAGWRESAIDAWLRNPFCHVKD